MFGRHRDRDNVATPILGQETVFREGLFDSFWLRAGFVDLVDGHDDRNVGRFGMMNGFHRLRHYTVICSHYEHYNVGDLGPPRAHEREGFVPRCIQKDNVPPLYVHVIGADVLRDPTSLRSRHIGLAYGIQQGGLAVVDMTHNGDDRWSRDAVSRIVGDFLPGLCFLFEADNFRPEPELRADVLCNLQVQGLVYRSQNPLGYKLLDNVFGLDLHLFRQLFQRYALGNGDRPVVFRGGWRPWQLHNSSHTLGSFRPSRFLLFDEPDRSRRARDRSLLLKSFEDSVRDLGSDHFFRARAHQNLGLRLWDHDFLGDGPRMRHRLFETENRLRWGNRLSDQRRGRSGLHGGLCL